MFRRVLTSLAFAAVTGAAQAETSAATVIDYNALGGAENGGDSFASAGPILLDEAVNTKAATLTSVVLTLKLAKADLGSFRVVGYGVNSQGLPNGETTIATVADSTLTVGGFKQVTIKPATPIALTANTHYFVGIAKQPGGKSSVVFGNTVDPKVLARPSVAAGGFYYNNGGLQQNAGGPYQIAVTVTPTP